jgi:hypothetical protein
VDEKMIKRISEKIAKCLALSMSENAHESELAKRQAKALMKKYNLTMGDVVASQIHSKKSKTGSRHMPPLHLVYLSHTIAKAFGCQAISCSGGGWDSSHVEFLGIGIKPELASYTFDVLSRLIKRDRTQYLTTLWRYKRSNKIRMANIFCEHWVFQISRQVHEFAGSKSEEKAISAYKLRAFGDSLELDERSITQNKNLNDREAVYAANIAANDVSLRQPIHSQRNTLLS